MTIKSLLARSLQVSLEGEEGVTEINPLSDETVVQLDQVLEEARGAADDVQAADDTVDELETAADSMESIVAALESHIAEGGMSPQTALTHRIALHAALRRLPIDPSQYSLSTESFGGTGDKLVASQEALEGAKELLSKIWNGIVNAIKSAVEAVKNFFAQIGKSGPAVVAAGKALEAKAKANGGTFKVEIGKVIPISSADMLFVDGKFEPVKALENVVKGYDYGVAGYSEKIRSMLMPLIQVVQSGGVTPQRLNEAADKVDVSKVGITTAKNFLPGGYFFDLQQGEGEGLKKLASTSFKLGREKPKTSGSFEIKPMNASDIASMAREVQAIGRKMIESQKVITAAEKGVNAIVDSGNKLAAKGGTLDKSEVSAAKDVMAKLNKAARLMTGCGPQYLSYMGSVAKAAVSAGNALLKQNAKPKEAEPEKK